MFRARLPSVFITSHKIQAFYRICTLSPLDAALTLQLSKKNAQHDTSKVLRLPRKMSKVLRPPRKMQIIFWKRRKSIALVTQNDFGHVMKHALSIAYWLESINPSCKLLIWKKNENQNRNLIKSAAFLLIFFIDLLIDLFFDYFIDFDFVFHSFFLMHVWLL